MDAAGHADGFDMPYHYNNGYPANSGLEGELIQQMISEIGIKLTGGVEDSRAVGSVKSQGALGVASSERGRGAARDLSALSI